MKRVLPILLMMIFFTSVPCIAGSGSKIYTNDDLNSYKKTTDGRAEQMQERQDEFQTSRQQNRNQEIINNNNYLNKQAYYTWCQAGTDAREMISKAREELEKTKLRTQTSNFNRDDSARFERDVENAKMTLKYAEDRLSHLEKEARIKDIRPGWIRCQYE